MNIDVVFSKPIRFLYSNINDNRWLQNGEVENVPVNDQMITVPAEEGVYIYDFFARWDKGDSSYAFVIEVKVENDK